MNQRRWILAVLCAAQCACASAPAAPGRERVATAMADATGVDTGRLDAPAAWTLPPGVSLTDGLTMDEAVAAALWNNPDFHAALAQLGLARADLIDAGLLKNPVLSLLFPVGPKQLEAAVNLAVDAMWQRPKRVEVARLNADAVAEALVADGLRLVADVRRAYVEAEAAARAETIAAEQADIARRLADMAAGRLRAGDISEFEAGLARTDAATAAAAAIAGTAAREQAFVTLRAVMGAPYDLPPAALAGPARESTACAPMGDLVPRALAARPEVRGAELQIEAAGARAGLERGRVLSLTATLDMNGEGKQGFEAGPGIAVELPILSQNQGGRTRAAAELELATRRYSAVRAGVIANLERALSGLAGARATAAVLDASFDQGLADQRRQAQSLYDAGEISLLALLEARRRLNDAGLARVMADLGLARAAIDVQEAIGGRCGTQ